MPDRTRIPLAIAVALLAATCGPVWTSAASQSGGADKLEKKSVAPKSAESSSRASNREAGEKAAKAKAASPRAGASDPNPSKSSSNTDMDRFGYRIGVEDELQISVWREPELSMPVVVRPDGMITLPLLSDVQAIGLKTEELQALLTEKFKSYVNDPQVTVIVRTIRSRKVYLAGQVSRQGAFPLNGRKTVTELIVEAGGLGPFAKKGSIYVLRNQDGRQVRLPLNYSKVIAGKVKDIELLPGDMVIVP